MKIFITNLHSRKEMLVANSVAHETNSSIEIFDPINIYDIYLSDHPCIIIISEDDQSNIFVSKFINDLKNESISYTKNTIIYLYKNNQPSLGHNFIAIPYNAFCHYNEYAKIETENQGYILCELNCISQKKNSILDSIIYPENNEIPVRLVNCPRFDHPQNLGIVNDHDMLKLIAGCSVYVGLTENYIYDSINMKKPTLTTVNNKIIDPIKSLSMNDIMTCVFDESYLVELNKNKISNIIKYKLK